MFRTEMEAARAHQLATEPETWLIGVEQLRATTSSIAKLYV